MVGGDSSRRTAARYVHVMKLLLIFNAVRSATALYFLQQMALLCVQGPISQQAKVQYSQALEHCLKTRQCLCQAHLSACLQTHTSLTLSWLSFYCFVLVVFLEAYVQGG